MSKIETCLWFDKDGEAAANFYVSLLPDSRIDEVLHSPAHYPAGQAGDVLLVRFTLAGQTYLALNGGAGTPYTNAMSLSVTCDDQAEVDRLWMALTADGGKEVQCGWLNDRWGVPWQIVPTVLPRLLADPDRAMAQRVFVAMQGMVKLDVAALEAAAAG